MQAARMSFPWLGAGYRNLNQLEPPMSRRLLVSPSDRRSGRSRRLLTESAGRLTDGEAD
jgi:hypothetical protein